MGGRAVEWHASQRVGRGAARQGVKQEGSPQAGKDPVRSAAAGNLEVLISSHFTARQAPNLCEERSWGIFQTYFEQVFVVLWVFASALAFSLFAVATFEATLLCPVLRASIFRHRRFVFPHVCLTKRSMFRVMERIMGFGERTVSVFYDRANHGFREAYSVCFV